MTKHKPTIRGRGNVAPPPGYRPGLKARWLHPRPTYTHLRPDPMPFTLISIPFDQTLPNLIDPPDNGADLYTVPAASYCEATILWVSPPDQDCYVQLNPSDSPSGSSGTLARVSQVDPGTIPTIEVQQAQPSDTGGLANASSLSSLLLAIVPTHLYLYCHSTATPVTALSGILVLKIYS